MAAARTFVEDLKRAMEWLTGHFLYTPEQVGCLQDFFSCVLAQTFVAGSLGPVIVKLVVKGPALTVYTQRGKNLDE